MFQGWCQTYATSCQRPRLALQPSEVADPWSGSSNPTERKTFPASRSTRSIASSLVRLRSNSASAEARCLQPTVHNPSPCGTGCNCRHYVSTSLQILKSRLRSWGAPCLPHPTSLGPDAPQQHARRFVGGVLRHKFAREALRGPLWRGQLGRGGRRPSSVNISLACSSSELPARDFRLWSTDKQMNDDGSYQTVSMRQGPGDLPSLG